MKIKTILILLSVIIAFASCKSTKEIQYIDRKIYVTDTVKTIQRDTIIVTNTKTDSVVVTIYDSVGIDQNTGETHHYHNESRESYKNNETDTYKAIHDENEHLRREVEELREKAENIIEKEKNVYIWWPCVLICIVVIGISLYFFIRKKFR